MGDQIADADLVLDQTVVDDCMDIIKAHATGLDPEDEFQRVELLNLHRIIAILEETYDSLDEGMLARAARDLVGVGDSHVQTSRRQYQAAYLVKVLVHDKHVEELELIARCGHEGHEACVTAGACQTL